MSYSPLASSGAAARLARRDLFDVRFQLLNEEHEEGIADASTDLIPGVYEGGLKTWECALDLVDELATRTTAYQKQDPSWPSGRHIAEIGCGTAVPTCYLLYTIFTTTPSNPTLVDLCDYNEQVLSLVVLPNILLTWYFSAGPGASQPARTGDLEIDDTLLAHFEQTLREKQIHLRFFSGGWDTLTLTQEATPRADVLLSSETVYAVPSLPALCTVLQNTSYPTQLDTPDAGLTPHTTLCLIAAKVLYFGVGGGTHLFQQALTEHGGWSAPVRENTRGVNRVVLRVGFNQT